MELYKQDFERAFAAIDTDKDEQISRYENNNALSIYKSFKRIDKNKNLFLSNMEMN